MAEAGTAEAGTAEAGTAEAGTAEAGTAEAETEEAATAEAETEEAATAEAATAEAATVEAAMARAATAETAKPRRPRPMRRPGDAANSQGGHGRGCDGNVLFLFLFLRLRQFVDRDQAEKKRCKIIYMSKIKTKLYNFKISESPFHLVSYMFCRLSL
jgi:hypothetical protein